MRLTRTPRVVVAVTAAVLVLSACTASPPDAAPTPARTPAADAVQTPSEDAFAEREAFFDAQGRPQEGSLPTPQTPEQAEFLAQQRAYVESQGGTWDEFYDGVALAVTLDACETSILNGHEVMPETARAHIETSPLMSEIAAGDPAATQGLASIMVFGTGFVCPADAPQWEAAYAELYG